MIFSSEILIFFGDFAYMNEETQKYYHILLDKLEETLEVHGFDAIQCETGKDALAYIVEHTSTTDVIGYGGSKSLEEIGFFDTFTPDTYPNIINRNKPGLTQDEKAALWRKALTADVFLASPNAVAMSGEMIFIDKNGNRNAAVTYGPKHVYLIVGRNKITDSAASALTRSSDVAAVKNNLRFNTGNPCTLAGRCLDCESDSRLCGVTTVLQRCVPEKTKTVILVNEDLGF